MQGLQARERRPGIPGPAGKDGEDGAGRKDQRHTHIAYANSADGQTDFSVSDSNRDYIGMYVGFWRQSTAQTLLITPGVRLKERTGRRARQESWGRWEDTISAYCLCQQCRWFQRFFHDRQHQQTVYWPVY